jgi:predicted O-methyltransferase YrrM
MHEFAVRLYELADFLGVSGKVCGEYVKDLEESELVNKIVERLQRVPEFQKAGIKDITGFHLFRTFLYVMTRILKPTLFLETGVQHGFSSAFILQAMEHNEVGRLVSIDLPHIGGEYLEQGTSLLPEGYSTGWAIPENLHHRHDLRLGDASRLLPAYFLAEPPPDIFMHDSDHRYHHMVFELSLAWRFMVKGFSFLVVDNIEQNSAFHDFCAGTKCENIVVVSYPPEHPEYWLHGVVRR